MSAIGRLDWNSFPHCQTEIQSCSSEIFGGSLWKIVIGGRQISGERWGQDPFVSGEQDA